MTASGTTVCATCGGSLTPDGRCSACGVVNALREEAVYQQARKGTSVSQNEILSFASRTARSVRPAFLLNKATNEKFSLGQSVSKIGRDATNNISIANDHYISRHHAWVLQMQGGYWVEDLGSTNGTLLNGELLSERKQIFAGDRITFGKTEFVFAVE